MAAPRKGAPTREPRTERERDVKRAWLAEESCGSIAKRHGVSRQRISQLAQVMGLPARTRAWKPTAERIRLAHKRVEREHEKARQAERRAERDTMYLDVIRRIQAGERWCDVERRYAKGGRFPRGNGLSLRAITEHWCKHRGIPLPTASKSHVPGDQERALAMYEQGHRPDHVAKVLGYRNGESAAQAMRTALARAGRSTRLVETRLGKTGNQGANGHAGEGPDVGAATGGGGEAPRGEGRCRWQPDLYEDAGACAAQAP